MIRIIYSSSVEDVFLITLCFCAVAGVVGRFWCDCRGTCKIGSTLGPLLNSLLPSRATEMNFQNSNLSDPATCKNHIIVISNHIIKDTQLRKWSWKVRSWLTMVVIACRSVSLLDYLARNLLLSWEELHWTIPGLTGQSLPLIHLTVDRMIRPSQRSFLHASRLWESIQFYRNFPSQRTCSTCPKCLDSVKNPSHSLDALSLLVPLALYIYIVIHFNNDMGLFPLLMMCFLIEAFIFCIFNVWYKTGCLYWV